MRILQAGAAKSGNLWLYKILDQIFEKAGIPKRSHVQNQPIHSLAGTWPLSYPEQADIDMLDIQNERCFWRISTIFSMPVKDIRKYVSSASHVWTHSRICDNSLRVYPLFDRIIYIIRDPRDRAVSEAKFAFSDYMQLTSPCPEESPSEYLENNLEEMMNRWRWHVYDHLRYARELNIHVVFYERLLRRFYSELNRLLNYLGIELSDADKECIAQAVSFSSMKKENPGHLRKGTSGNWKNHFTEDQQKQAVSITSPLLSYLSYDKDSLPRFPDYIDRKFLENNVHEIGATPD